MGRGKGSRGTDDPQKMVDVLSAVRAGTIGKVLLCNCMPTFFRINKRKKRVSSPPGSDGS